MVYAGRALPETMRGGGDCRI